MKRPICRNFIRDMENIPPDTFLALLCGSSLIEDNPRDTDIFIYTNREEKIFSHELFDRLSQIDVKARLTYLDALQFYSLKYHSGGIDYSLHIVSVEKLLALISKASLLETYTDINVFDVKLYSQTVYRKWILETESLTGDFSFRETLLHELSKQKKPVEAAKQEIVSRLKNNISYFREKASNDKVACNVIAGQIFNNLVNYCYLLNDVYYGTVKYIKSDLETFTINSDLCCLAVDLMESLNIKSVQALSHEISRIADYIS